MIKKIKAIKPLVHTILTGHPDTRDNDKLLMLKVWSEQNSHLRSRTFTFYTFAIDFINGKYADPETIRRSRQMVQEKYPHLRGQGYAKRKQLEKETQAEIKFT